ncbi:MAG: presenilin family intramembrane aspartyl protease [archaeon]
MKHDLNVLMIIISIFFLTQIVGLFLISKDISSTEEVNGEIVVHHQDTSVGPRPETKGGESFLYLGFAVLIGTILILIIMKYKKMKLWKAWFFMAIFFAISISLGVLMDSSLAFFFAFILAILKIYKNNLFIHNFTEILMYSGLAVLIVPIFDLFWVFMILLAISLYDMYAVWKSKHMVKMAKFQAESKLFAGIMIPYKEHKGIELTIPVKPSLQPKRNETKNAILGGGDVAFPLIFAGVVMETLIRQGATLSTAFFQTTIISVAVTFAILGLFIFAKKDRFYPAMPVVSLGCVVGYLIVLIL